MDNLMRLSEAARALKVHPNTVRRWIAESRITAAKTPGGHYRIARREVERVLGIDGAQRESAKDE
jgi:excisionase family DNA binding protein